MGDRYVVRIKLADDKPEERPLCLYSHWGGDRGPETLRRAIAAAGPRWGESYGPRIVLSRLIPLGDPFGDPAGGSGHCGTMSYGLSRSDDGGEYPILTVDFRERVVLCEGKPGVWTFAAFAALERADWDTWNGAPSATPAGREAVAKALGEERRPDPVAEVSADVVEQAPEPAEPADPWGEPAL